MTSRPQSKTQGTLLLLLETLNGACKTTALSAVTAASQQHHQPGLLSLLPANDTTNLA
jgi:hypothetical protein